MVADIDRVVESLDTDRSKYIRSLVRKDLATNDNGKNTIGKVEQGICEPSGI